MRNLDIDSGICKVQTLSCISANIKLKISSQFSYLDHGLP